MTAALLDRILSEARGEGGVRTHPTIVLADDHVEALRYELVRRHEAIDLLNVDIDGLRLFRRKPPEGQDFTQAPLLLVAGSHLSNFVCSGMTLQLLTRCGAIDAPPQFTDCCFDKKSHIHGSELNASLFAGDRQRTVFDDVSIHGCQFNAATFKNCIFRDCRISHSDFVNATFENCQFIHCHFTDVDLEGATFNKDCTFSKDCSLSGTRNATFPLGMVPAECLHAAAECEVNAKGTPGMRVHDPATSGRGVVSESARVTGQEGNVVTVAFGKR